MMKARRTGAPLKVGGLLSDFRRQPLSLVCAPSCKTRPPPSRRLMQETQEPTLDVYAGPQLLQEGIYKHVISVFVADEAGIINRVAGVFARRGMNIETLAVGLNVDKALFTITVNGTRSEVSNMVKQLTKLVKVRFVEDLTSKQRLDRELSLFKVGVAHGVDRSEVLEMTNIFGGKVVDVAPGAVTVAISGDPGKLYAFEMLVRPFGLLQLSRTGRITLLQSDANLDLPSLQEYSAGASPAKLEQDSARAQADNTPAYEQAGADVYAVSSGHQAGPWTVRNLLLEPQTSSKEGIQPYTLLVEVDDVPGVLNEVTGVIARRGYNIQSLAVGNSEKFGRSRITMVLPGQSGSISKLIKQLMKLIVVQEVVDVTDVPHVKRELILVKVRCTAAQRAELKALADIFRAEISHLSTQTMTLEMIGTDEVMYSLQALLLPYGVLEVARTGSIALLRESKVDSALLASSMLRPYI